MTPFLHGFADELVKTGSSDQPPAGKQPAGMSNGRKMLTSTLIAAISAPLMGLVGKAIARSINNGEVRRVVRATVDPEHRQSLEKEIHIGQAIGRHLPGAAARARPLMTHGELAASAATGAIGGSALQAVRDFFLKPKQPKQPR